MHLDIIANALTAMRRNDLLPAEGTPEVVKLERSSEQLSPPHREGTRVSVVVPSYNHASFVALTLRSIFRQTFVPAELLVIDDGSTDSSPKIIDTVLHDCPFPCEFVARQNRGLSATLNEGFTRTGGDYFAYLGSDDLWLPDFLQARVSLLESRRDAVLGYGHAFLVDKQNAIVDCTADWANYADGDARAMLLETTAPMSPTVLYRRECTRAAALEGGVQIGGLRSLSEVERVRRIRFRSSNLVCLAAPRLKCQLESDHDAGRAVAIAARGSVEVWIYERAGRTATNRNAFQTRRRFPETGTKGAGLEFANREP